jgi:hypothetical protein
MHPGSFYELQSSNWDQMILEPKNSKLDAINEQYFARMEVSAVQKEGKTAKIKFESVIKVKTFV